MNETASSSHRMNRWLTIGWTLILVKCAVLPWAMRHWNVPFHPGWIVWPTLAFAGFATLIVFLRRGKPAD